jgi:hypothetical protein
MNEETTKQYTHEVYMKRRDNKYLALDEMKLDHVDWNFKRKIYEDVVFDFFLIKSC